jgi:hypothetical protein
MASGIFSSFAFGIESVWGTKATANHLLEAKDGSGVNVNLDNQSAEAFNGQMAKNVDVFPGLRKDEGQFDMYFLTDIAPYFLVNLLGAVVSSGYNPGDGVVSGVYEHVITESPTRPTMTVEQQVGDLPTVCTGFQGNELELAIATGEAITLSVKGFAKNTAILETPSTPVASTHRLLHHADDINVLVDDVAFSGITSFKITYKNNAVAEHDISHGSEAAFRGLGKTEYEGEIELIIDSTNAIPEFQKYLNNAMRKMKITVQGDTLGATDVKEQLIIDLAKVNFSEMEVPATFETIKATIKFIGVLDKATGEHLQFTVINDVASLAS